MKQVDDKNSEIFAYEMFPLSCYPGGRPARDPLQPQLQSGEVERTALSASEEEAAISGRKHGKETSSDSEVEGLPAKMMRSDEEALARAEEGSSFPAPVVSDMSSSGGSGGGGAQQPSGSRSDGGGDGAQAPVIIQTNEPRQAVIMEWHSCSICLEEMVDTELLTHVDCGAVLCSGCLQSSVQHYSKDDDLIPCPVRIELHL